MAAAAGWRLRPGLTGAGRGLGTTVVVAEAAAPGATGAISSRRFEASTGPGTLPSSLPRLVDCTVDLLAVVVLVLVDLEGWRDPALLWRRRYTTKAITAASTTTAPTAAPMATPAPPLPPPLPLLPWDAKDTV